MSTQSGISVSDELSARFTACEADDSIRAMKVVIEDERLVPKETTPRHGTEAEDFDAIPPLLENTKDAPAYILVKLDSDSNNEQEVQWCLCTYVPDHANVRNKMLYSSTKATLARQLGEGKFKYNIHASTLDELSSSGYKRFLQHQSSQAPMTAREKEMADIKSAEGIEASMQGTSVRHSSINNASGSGAQVGMAWSDEAVNAVGALAKGEKEVVQLGLNTKEEIVILLSAAEQGEALSLPADEPSYTFYKHATGVVFIYCCPDTSPIRWRMMYSSNCQPIVQDAKQHGVEVVKKLETSTPAEITREYIDSECAPARDETSTPPVATGFARPARPGRRR